MKSKRHNVLCVIGMRDSSKTAERRKFLHDEYGTVAKQTVLEDQKRVIDARRCI